MFEAHDRMVQRTADGHGRKNSSFEFPLIAKCREHSLDEPHTGCADRPAPDLFPIQRPHFAFPTPARQVRGFAQQTTGNEICAAPGLLSHQDIAQPIRLSARRLVAQHDLDRFIPAVRCWHMFAHSKKSHALFMEQEDPARRPLFRDGA